MPATANTIRLQLFVSALLSALIALAIFTFIVPRVQGDTFPLASPQAAATGFTRMAVYQLVMGIVVFFLALRVSDTRPAKPAMLKVAGAFAVLLAFDLFMSAGAFQAHGPQMANVVVTLIFSGAAGVLAGSLVFHGGDLVQDLRTGESDQGAGSRKHRDGGALSVFLAFCLMATSASLTLGFGDEGLGLGIGAVLAVAGCYFIIRRNPKSLWYAPLIASLFVVVIAVSNQGVWGAWGWVPIAAYLGLCVVVSILAARHGEHSALAR